MARTTPPGHGVPANVVVVVAFLLWLLLGVRCWTGVLMYWAIQAGLLTPFTFARHRLSPLAAFTSGAYFLHNGRR